ALREGGQPEPAARLGPRTCHREPARAHPGVSRGDLRPVRGRARPRARPPRARPRHQPDPASPRRVGPGRGRRLDRGARRVPAPAGRPQHALRNAAAEGRRTARARRRPDLRRPPRRRRARPGGEAPLPHRPPGDGRGRLMDVAAILAEVRTLANRGELQTIVARYGALDDTPESETWQSTELLYEIGRAFGMLGNEEKVERYLLRCAELAPPRAALDRGSDPPTIRGEHTLACRGELQLRRGDLDAALAAFAEARDLDPESSYLWERLGRVHELRGELEAAEDAYRRSTLLPRGAF